MHPRVMCAALMVAAAMAAATTLGAQRTPPREHTLETLGIRIVETPDPSGSASGIAARPLSRVVAIREGGPAHYAGLAPGDVIFQARGRYAHPQALVAEASSLGTTDSFVWQVYYTVEGEDAPRQQLAVLAPAPAGEGRWITDVPSHRGGRAMLRGSEELRASARRRFEELRGEALAYIGADPCAVRVSELERRGVELNFWDTRGRSQRAYSHQYTLVDIAHTACSNARTGGLPAFEAALWVMTERRVSPCSYDPALDYRALLRDPAYAQGGTRSDYDTSILIRIRSLRSSDPAGGACLLSILAARLTGRPWHPVAGPEPDAAPQAAPPPRRGGRRP